MSIVLDSSLTLAWSATVQMAAQHRLTVYDAAYLELAQRRRLPLATLDAALGRAAEASGVRIVPTGDGESGKAGSQESPSGPQ